MEKTSESIIENLHYLQKSKKFELKNSDWKTRVKKLKALKQQIINHRSEIHQALMDDFGKSFVETDLTEVLPVISYLNVVIKELKYWMEPRKVKTPIIMKGTSSWVQPEAKGNCLIISPWNYPFNLVLYPFITSYCAGNTSMIKPSEFTPNTNKIANTILSKVFDEKEVAFVFGEVSETTYLLDKKFDHIFFTGSTEVGKIVMNKASDHLASVSLELGGKSPVVIDREANIEEAVKKIVWGKFVNAGQTCIAPDYLLVHETQQELVLDKMRHYIEVSYGEDFTSKPSDLCNIITSRHTQRLVDLIDDAKDKGAVVEFGGESSVDDRYLSPTILSHVNLDSKIMKEEIFGPILPIVTYSTLDQAVEIVNSYENPLASYIFTNSASSADYFSNYINSGNCVINDVLLHAGHPHLPFGGAGASGIGKYHGIYGFDEMSNLKGVLKRKIDLGASHFYPPYTNSKEKTVGNILGKGNSLL